MKKTLLFSNVVGDVTEKEISNIKFNKKYTNQRKIEKIVFSDIILDYDNYITYQNKLEFSGRTKIEIEL